MAPGTVSLSHQTVFTLFFRTTAKLDEIDPETLESAFSSEGVKLAYSQECPDETTEKVYVHCTMRSQIEDEVLHLFVKCLTCRVTNDEKPKRELTAYWFRAPILLRAGAAGVKHVSLYEGQMEIAKQGAVKEIFFSPGYLHILLAPFLNHLKKSDSEMVSSSKSQYDELKEIPVDSSVKQVFAKAPELLPESAAGGSSSSAPEISSEMPS